MFLFYDTIYENIAVGQPDATQQDVEHAARAAQCHDFIMSLPNGYHTRIGDHGVYLSGGETQRICVARAILKNAPILVLDEATAFADPENEVSVQRAIDTLIKPANKRVQSDARISSAEREQARSEAKGRTVIVIAHRLKTIKNANQILVLNHGRIVEQGRHTDLMAKDGLYARLWNIQKKALGWQV